MEDIITIAVVNFKPAFEDKEANLRRILGYAEAACKRGADMIIFPEMALTGYDYFIADDISLEDKISAAEPADGISARKVAEIAQKYGAYIIYGAAEKVPLSESTQSVLYNAAFIADPSGKIETYRKIHPFGPELKWCRKGSSPCLINTKWGPVGIGICYDSYQFPELVRYYVSKGARLYLNPTAEIEEINKSGSRKAFYSYYDLLEYAVKCNTIFLASANLTGWDREDYFAGGSYIIGPKITPFFETDVTCYGGAKENFQEGLSFATIDLSLASRRLCQPQSESGQPDYRGELYKTW